MFCKRHSTHDSHNSTVLIVFGSLFGWLGQEPGLVLVLFDCFLHAQMRPPAGAGHAEEPLNLRHGAAKSADDEI